MTDHYEKTIGPQDRMIFGGATINKNEVASKEVVKKNGKETFVINFKNGTRLEYPKQAAKNKASVRSVSDFQQQENKSVAPCTYTWIDNFYGASFNGSEMADSVSLGGCTSCNVDVANDFPKGKKDEQKHYVGSDHVVIWDDSCSFRSQKNKVTQDANDVTYIMKTKGKVTDVTIKGAGTHVEGQE